MKKYFGTDGIRGTIDEDIDVTLCMKVAKSYAQYILDNNLPRVLFLGTDTRYTRYVLKSSLLAGLLNYGIDVIDVGIVPTGMISFLVMRHEVAGGLMLTASHNPPDMNGIKFFDHKGRKISADIEDGIEINMDSSCLPASKEKGRVFSGEKYRKEYINFTCKLSNSLKNYTILLDCANGSAGSIAPQIFKKLGAKVIAINCGQSGLNINVNCGAVYPNQLFEQLMSYRADIAFAYDGDADRLVVVLQDGRVLDGDDLLYVFANYEKASAVVGTVMTNGGLGDALASQHITLYRSAVGDRNVLECMIEHMCMLGAESSGHLCHTKYNMSCDGIMNSVYIAKYLIENSIVLPKKYPMLTANLQLTLDQRIQAEMIDFSQVVQPLEEKWGARILIRLSGTEPKLRVMLEEENDQIKEHMEMLISIVKEKINLLE